MTDENPIGNRSEEPDEEMVDIVEGLADEASDEFDFSPEPMTLVEFLDEARSLDFHDDPSFHLCSLDTVVQDLKPDLEMFKDLQSQKFGGEIMNDLFGIGPTDDESAGIDSKIESRADNILQKVGEGMVQVTGLADHFGIPSEEINYFVYERSERPENYPLRVIEDSDGYIVLHPEKDKSACGLRARDRTVQALFGETKHARYWSSIFTGNMTANLLASAAMIGAEPRNWYDIWLTDADPTGTGHVCSDD